MKWQILIIYGLIALMTTTLSVAQISVEPKPDTKTTTNYTMNSKTTCTNGECKLELNTGQAYGYEDDKWKPMKELRSYKNTTQTECIIKYDGYHKAECLDWNATSITIKTSLDETLQKEAETVQFYIINKEYNETTEKEETKTDWLGYTTYETKEEKNQIIQMKIGETLKIGENSTTITINMTHGDDDAYCWSTTEYRTANNIRVGLFSGQDYQTILTFSNIPIDQDTTINNAVIQLDGYLNDNDDINAHIYGDDADDSYNSDVRTCTGSTWSGITNTTALEIWTVTDSFSAGVGYNTTNISTIVQEIKNRAGWASGNNMTFIIDNIDKSAYVGFATQEHSSYEEPRLIIEYVSGGGEPASCTTPTENLTITTDTELCEGTYVLPYGIKAGANDITINCTGTIISGDNHTAGDNAGFTFNWKNNVTLQGCTFQDYEFNIYGSGTADNTVYNNTVLWATTMGMRFLGGYGFNVTSNTVNMTQKNLSNGTYAEFFDTNNSAIYFGNSGYNHIIENNIMDLVRYGADVRGGAHHITIRNNQISNVGTNGYGIHLDDDGAGYNDVYNNVIINGGWDAIVDQTNHTLIHHNNITGIAHHGIDSLQYEDADSTAYSTNSSWYNNLIVENDAWGDPSFNASPICIFGNQKQNSKIYNNICNNSRITVEGNPTYTHSNQIYDNIIDNATGAGIYVLSNATIYNNTIINQKPFGTDNFHVELGSSFTNNSWLTPIYVNNNTFDETARYHFLRSISNITLIEDDEINITWSYGGNIRLNYNDTKNIQNNNKTITITSLTTPNNDIYNYTSTSVLLYDQSSYTQKMTVGINLGIGNHGTAPSNTCYLYTGGTWNVTGCQLNETTNLEGSNILFNGTPSNITSRIHGFGELKTKTSITVKNGGQIG